jgi:hypothetical protein
LDGKNEQTYKTAKEERSIKKKKKKKDTTIGPKISKYLKKILIVRLHFSP